MLKKQLKQRPKQSKEAKSKMNLVNELNQKQALKFQLCGLDRGFIKRTLSENNEGIFNLDSVMGKNSTEIILKYLQKNCKDYDFQMGDDKINPMIYFRRN